MTVTIDAKALNSAIARATASIRPPKGQTLLGFVRVAAADGELTIEATDLDIRVVITVPAQGEFPSTLIEGDRLTAVTGRLKDRGDLRLGLKGDVAELDAGNRSRFTLPTLKDDAWPSIKQAALPHSFTMSGKALARICTALQPAISDEQTRYYLCGIYLHAGSVADARAKGSLCAVATDGHKAFARSVPVPDLPAGMPGIIVPSFTCGVLTKLLPDDADVEVSCGEDRIAVRWGDVDLMSKLVAGTFPDWRRVIPRHDPVLSFDAKALAAAAATASAGASPDKSGKAIKLTFGEGETSITAADRDSAFTGTDMATHIVLADKAPDFDIGVNAVYLVEAVGSLEAETVEIAMQDPGAPIVLTGATFDDRLACVMPQRIK